MTHRAGDLCATKECYDLAHPGHDHCLHCIADRQAERELTAAEAARLTKEHDLRVQSDDEVAA